jgi:hypothetical protein
MNDLHVGLEHLGRSLREIDWRFLTANPTPRRVLALCPPDIIAALREVAQQVVCEPRAARECDLVVMLRPARHDVDSAWRALLPGGHLALVGVRGPIDRLHGARVLQARGFERVRTVWRWPLAQEGPASFWVPAHEAWALRYLARRPSRTPSAKRRVGAAVFRIAAGAGVLPPAVVLARKPGSPPAASAELLQALAGAVTPLDALLLTGGAHVSNKVVAIVAPGRMGRPEIAVKFARVPASVPDLEREHRVLGFVEGRRRRPSRVTLPRPRFAVPVGESFAVGMSVVDASAFRLRDVEAGRNLAENVVRWLETLVDPAPTSPDAWWQDLVDDPLRRFNEASAGFLTADVREAIHAGLPALRDLRLAVEHRDCSPWNVLVQRDGRLAVLDWESAEERGLPARDLTYFLLYWGWYSTDPGRRGDALAALRAVRDATTPVGAIAAQLERSYCEAAGLTSSQLAGLRLLTWTHHAVSEHRRLELAADRSRPSEPGVFLRLLAEEVRLQG